MSRYTVICHRCGKSTFVDLTKTISDQRCRACRGFLQGVDVSIGDKPRRHRKMVYKVAGDAGREPEWQDQPVAVIPRRQHWPRYYRWIICGGFILLLSSIGFVSFRKSLDSTRVHRTTFGQEEPEQVDVRFTKEWRLKATAEAKKALEAKDVDELLPLLFHPEVSDDVIRRYYATEEKLPLGSELEPTYVIRGSDSDENKVAFLFVDAAQRRRAFVLVEKPEGMKVDWPSLVGLGEMSLKEYLKTSPAEVVVLRARARIGHYYNDYFADSSRWLSIRLCDVTDENVLYGYVDRSAPIASMMENSFADPEGDRVKPDEPVIVVLKHPPGNAASNQTQIVSLVAMTWYQHGGLTPIIEQARAQDAARTGKAPPGQKPDQKEQTPPPVKPEPSPQDN